MPRRAAPPAADAAAALRAARTGGGEEEPFAYVALGSLVLTPEVLDDLAGRVALRLGAEHQQQHQQQETQWLDVAAAAQHMACSTHRIYRLVHMRRIPHHKEGQRVLFDRAELDHWVRSGGARRVA